MTFAAAFTASLVALAAAIAPAAAQTSLKQSVVGTWKLVSVFVDGPNKVEPYGPNPHGIMFMDAAGNFSVSIVRAGIAKFESKNRTTGTDAENKAAVQGSLAYFGTYTIDEADKSVTVKIESSNYPNFEGESQKRILALTGDELLVTNPAPSGGGGVAKQIWKRLK
ncbi:MAG: lipocalin-like domain-containing protein [Pseudolabrys sp.]|nr:lipocalin-like domain-containing protein [Pseudolabrys sp.]